MEKEHKQPLIFLVDDDEDDLYFIKSAIVKNIPNCIVKCFIHGKQLIDSLDKIAIELPTFILMDLNMPVLNGKEALKIIRKKSETKNLPVVILTTSSNSAEKASCIQFGASKYVCKPTDMNVYDQLMQQLKHDFIDPISIYK